MAFIGFGDIRGLRLASLVLVAVTNISSAADYPIAGLHPDQRPAGAPVITSVHKDGAWYRRALTGVIPPYPASLHFLENQGNWYTPFIHPGMSAPYDLRGWHSESAQP